MTDFHSLYQSYAPQVQRFVLFLCGDASLADDITSDTFVRAWTARGKIREATVKAYLFTIARNLYRDSAFWSHDGAIWLTHFYHRWKARHVED
ncbi:MAG TPA: RNA polymerase sigma factor [Candidatus Angelobacter sp.]|nr:RNA polymerase sigma factor [Candidatus Angelobacter sp.]